MPRPRCLHTSLPLQSSQPSEEIRFGKKQPGATKLLCLSAVVSVGVLLVSVIKISSKWKSHDGRALGVVCPCVNTHKSVSCSHASFGIGVLLAATCVLVSLPGVH